MEPRFTRRLSTPLPVSLTLFSTAIMVPISQYEEVILKLSKRRKEILIALYLNAPFSDSNAIAKILGYSNFNSANLQIGNLGHIVSKETGIPPEETYIRRGKEVPSSYTLIHNYFEDGWELVENLEVAMENLGWV